MSNSPGINITTITAPNNNASLVDASGQLFLVGQAARGDVTAPVLLRGLADAVAVFDGRVTYGNLYDALAVFFAEGGTQAYVQRVVGAAATAGTLTLHDGATTPLPTLRVTAASPGAWSSRVSIGISAGSRSGTFRLGVYLDGARVIDAQNLVTAADAVAALSANVYVTATDLASISAGALAQPAVNQPTPLSAGTDNRSAITADDYVAALDLFDVGLGDGAVAIPGIGETVHDGLIAHATANNRIALLSADQGATVGDLTSLANSYDTEYAGMFAPWVTISDGARGIRTISPESFVAAKRAVAHDTVGAWRAPAGGLGASIGSSSGVVGLDQNFSVADGSTLDDGHVSAIRLIANSVRLYGWRSLSADEADYAYLSSRDLLNRLVILCTAAMEPYLFDPIDGRGHLIAAINGDLVGVLQPIADADGLYPLTDAVSGLDIDPGFLVVTDSSVNSALSLANNTIVAVISVRISPTSALINLTIIKVGATSSF